MTLVNNQGVKQNRFSGIKSDGVRVCLVCGARLDFGSAIDLQTERHMRLFPKRLPADRHAGRKWVPHSCPGVQPWFLEGSIGGEESMAIGNAMEWALWAEALVRVKAPMRNASVWSNRETC